MRISKNKTMLSKDRDKFIPISFNNTNRDLLNSNLSYNIDASGVYIDEKNKSNKYRITIDINGVFTNILQNTVGENSLETLSNDTFRSINSPLNNSFNDKVLISYEESFKTHLKNEDGWIGYNTPKDLSIDCNMTEMNPKRKDMGFISYNNNDNWSFSLLYIKSKRTPFEHDGLPITNSEQIIENGRELYRLYSPFKHNLKINDYINIYESSTKNKTYRVIDIGINDDYLDNYIVIDCKTLPIISQKSHIKKLTNNIESSYYQRVLGKLDKGDDIYNFYKLGFSNNIYGDDIMALNFIKMIDVDKYVDYLNRPLLNLYLGIFNNNQNDLFTDVESGYKINYCNEITPNYIPNVNTITSDLFSNKLEVIKQSNDDFILDFVEFNPFHYTETILSEVYHRFNTLNRLIEKDIVLNNIDSNGEVYTKNYSFLKREEGYMYDSFHAIPLKEMSDDIYYGTIYSELPVYAQKINDINFSWREVLPNNDSSINYPFVNNTHYVSNRVEFLLERQDPFGLYGLRYDSFPYDSKGIKNSFESKFIKYKVDKTNNDSIKYGI